MDTNLLGAKYIFLASLSTFFLMDSIGGWLGGKKSGANNPNQNNNLNQSKRK